MRAISILIAAEHPIALLGLRALLEAERSWKVVAAARNGREAAARAMQLRPDVAILGMSMPELNGLAAARLINKELPQTRILIIIEGHEQGPMTETLKAAAHGCVLQSDAERDLIPAVLALSQNRTFFPAPAAKMVSGRGMNRSAPQAPLSIRETEILRLLAEGRSNREAAAILGISTRTVENHRARVMHKLGLHSFSDLVRYAVRNKIVEN